MEEKEKFVEKVKQLLSEKKSHELIKLLDDETLLRFDSDELSNIKAEAYYLIGIKKIKENEYNTAENYFLKSLTIDPKNYYSNNAMGNIMFHNGKFEEAEKFYFEAIKIDKSEPLAYNGLGNVYAIKGDKNKAINYYLETIKLNPESADAYNGLGNVYYINGEFEKSENYYLKALKYNSKYVRALNGLANINIFHKKDYKKAEELYRMSIKHDKNFISPYNGLGILFYILENYEDAKKYFKKFIELSEIDDDFVFQNAISKISEIDKILANKDYETIKGIISNIKKVLEYKNTCLTHFTGLSIAKKIVFDKNKFRLSEGTYLNDTSEGTELFNFLEYESPLGKKVSSTDEYFVQKPFIGSFVSDVKHNDLTMWRMYGKEGKEEAKGCAITMNSKKLISEILTNLDISKETATENDFKFFKVAYKKGEGKFVLPDEKETSKKVKDLNKFCQELKMALKNFNSKEEKLEVQKDIEELLFEIAFLFKGIEYQYENEVRFLQKGVGFEKKIDTELEIPKVYIELADVSKSITKITLGPKVTKSDEWAASLYYYLRNQGIDAEIHISRQPFK